MEKEKSNLPYLNSSFKGIQLVFPFTIKENWLRSTIFCNIFQNKQSWNILSDFFKNIFNEFIIMKETCKTIAKTRSKSTLTFVCPWHLNKRIQQNLHQNSEQIIWIQSLDGCCYNWLQIQAIHFKSNSMEMNIKSWQTTMQAEQQTFQFNLHQSKKLQLNNHHCYILMVQTKIN